MKQHRVLVVAPRFPAINQPWIDTYLEQLLRNGIDFHIYTLNSEESVYGEKVDRLGLRKRILDFQLNRWSAMWPIVVSALRRPCEAVWLVPRAVRIALAMLRYRISPFKALACLIQFAAALPQFRHVALIHAHEEITGFHFALLSRLIDVPLVLTFHGLPPAGVGQLSNEKRRMMYDQCKVVIVNTEFARCQAVSVGALAERVRVLPQGLPLDDFPYRQRLPVGFADVVGVLTVGRFHRDKGQGYAILALRRLLSRGIRVSWTFIGVGPDLHRLETLAHKMRVDHAVTFRSGVTTEELAQLYRKSDFFVLPSVCSPNGHVETQGVVLQEAQSSGCIPIASRTGGIPECINHRVDAVLVRQRSSREIARAILELLENPAIQTALRHQGRRNVETRYAADVIGRRMAELLYSVNGVVRPSTVTKT